MQTVIQATAHRGNGGRRGNENNAGARSSSYFHFTPVFPLCQYFARPLINFSAWVQDCADALLAVGDDLAGVALWWSMHGGKRC